MASTSSSNNNNDTDTAANSIAANYNSVLERVQQAATSRQSVVRLVAVSKTKPITHLQAAYAAGCRVFGENYVQELVEKIPLMPNDCQWHFIGTLQSNKVNSLIQTAAATCMDRLTIETVTSIKLAHKLNQAVAAIAAASSTDNAPVLKVMVQVNTSNEDSKGGIAAAAAVDQEVMMELCHYIHSTTCDYLQLQGLMTIGAAGDVSCFETLRKCRDVVEKELDTKLELSMGMSGDFEEAISAGSTNVRVGSTIFGERDYSK